VALVNSSFDPAVELDVALLTTADRLRVFDMQGRERPVRARRTDGPLPAFPPPPRRTVEHAVARHRE